MNFRLAARTHKRDVLDNMEDVRRFIAQPFKPEQAQAFTETWFGVKEVVAVTWDDFPVGPQIRRMDVTVGGGDDSVTSGFRSTQVIDR